MECGQQGRRGRNARCDGEASFAPKDVASGLANRARIGALRDTAKIHVRVDRDKGVAHYVCVCMAATINIFGGIAKFNGND